MKYTESELITVAMGRRFGKSRLIKLMFEKARAEGKRCIIITPEYYKQKRVKANRSKETIRRKI